MRPAKAGGYRARITFYGPPASETLDTIGQPVDTPTFVAGPFWARVQPLVGHELVAAKQVKAQALFKVEMRFQGTSVVLSPLNWFLMNGRTFGIFDLKNVEERNRRYIFSAYEIQQGAASV